MPLPSGSKFGAYEVIDPLGAGGMGEVYRARDTQLNRQVAIKVLPEVFAADPDRLARFEREAQTLASLNHPHIAQIYGIERSGPKRALVMELVEGEDLAERLARGAIPLDEALPIARQIADALEAAHEQGIIHRDLKPGNVKVRSDGTAKVLDFGLAKAIAPDVRSGDQMNSPTFTSPATQAGIVLGTAAYMAPEQAKGKPVDRRADIWAFGVVLHEMLTGKNLWIGETGAETMAHVITREPDLSTLPPSTPQRLRNLIARCLVKDPRARLRDIGEARVALTEMAGGDVSAIGDERPVAASRGTVLAWTAAAAMAIAATVFAALWLRPSPVERHASLRASLPPPSDKAFGGSLALSPDGTRLVFDAAGRQDRQPVLWIQDLATGAATPIRHSEGGSRPFWSPDARHLGFFADGKLKRIDLQGGPAQVLADAPTPRGGSWSPDGRIVFAPAFRGGLVAIPAGGGSLTTVTKADGPENSHRWPVFLPGGHHVVFLSQAGEGGTRDDTSSIDVVGIDGSGRRKLVSANTSPLYADPGFLMFWRDGTLLAQRIDPARVMLSGEPFAVAQDVAYDQNEAVVATVSSSGRLVYLGGAFGGSSTPTLLDRAGKPLKAIAERGVYECGMALSPDGRRLVAGKTREGANGCDLWAYDLERGIQTPLTFEGRNEYAPIFAPDGRSIFYSTDTGKDAIYRKDVSGRGTPQVVFEATADLSPYSPGALMRDGRSLIVTIMSAKTRLDIMRYDLQSRSLTSLVQTPFNEKSPALSPDERWLAYASDRSGRFKVYVEALTGDGTVWPVSSDGGNLPQWRSDGRELFFVAPPDRVMAVSVLPGEKVRTSAPAELFRAHFGDYSNYVVLPDGQRFIAHLSDDRTLRQPLTVISDWRPR